MLATVIFRKRDPMAKLALKGIHEVTDFGREGLSMPMPGSGLDLQRVLGRLKWKKGEKERRI